MAKIKKIYFAAIGTNPSKFPNPVKGTKIPTIIKEIEEI